MIKATLLAVALAAFVPATTANQPEVGVTSLIENIVNTRADSEIRWRDAELGAAAHYLDDFNTGADSRLQLDLKDGAVFTLGENGEVTLDRFVYNPDPDVLGVTFSIIRGLFRFVSNGDGTSPDTASIRTGTAEIGIRGTIVEGAVGAEALEYLTDEAGFGDLAAGDDLDPGELAVIILREGEVEVTVDGEVVRLNQPDQAVAISRQRISRPFMPPRAALDRFDARLPRRGEFRREGPGGGEQQRQGAGQQRQSGEQQRPGEVQRPVAPDNPISNDPRGAEPGPAPGPGPGGGQQPGRPMP